MCVAIYTERSLRRIGNLFLASLAIADLFVSLLVMTFAGVNDILGENYRALLLRAVVGEYMNIICNSVVTTVQVKTCLVSVSKVRLLRCV